MLRIGTLIIGLTLIFGCRIAINNMARTTLLADQQFATEYSTAADECLRASDTRKEYDDCVAPWNAAADAVLALRNTALTLDSAQGRRAFRRSTCRWLEAARVVDALSPVPLPVIKTALDSKWRRKC